jgi:hypothetical protein
MSVCELRWWSRESSSFWCAVALPNDMVLSMGDVMVNSQLTKQFSWGK